MSPGWPGMNTKRIALPGPSWPGPSRTMSSPLAGPWASPTIFMRVMPPAQLELSEAELYDASTMSRALAPLASEEVTREVGGHGALIGFGNTGGSNGLKGPKPLKLKARARKR